MTADDKWYLTVVRHRRRHRDPRRVRLLRRARSRPLRRGRRRVMSFIGAAISAARDGHRRHRLAPRSGHAHPNVGGIIVAARARRVRRRRLRGRRTAQRRSRGVKRAVAARTPPWPRRVSRGASRTPHRPRAVYYIPWRRGGGRAELRRYWSQVDRPRPAARLDASYALDRRRGIGRYPEQASRSSRPRSVSFVDVAGPRDDPVKIDPKHGPSCR